MTKICNSLLTDTLKKLLGEASNTDQSEAQMIALYTQLQIVTKDPIGKLDPKIRESRNKSHIRLIEAVQEYLQAKLKVDRIEIAEGTIFNEGREQVLPEEVKQSYESPDL